ERPRCDDHGCCDHGCCGYGCRGSRCYGPDGLRVPDARALTSTKPITAPQPCAPKPRFPGPPFRFGKVRKPETKENAKSATDAMVTPQIPWRKLCVRCARGVFLFAVVHHLLRVIAQTPNIARPVQLASQANSIDM